VSFIWKCQNVTYFCHFELNLVV